MKKMIFEVSIIRPLVILLLILYHSLCPWMNGWEETPCFEENKIYFWIANLISGFRIETIALVAGYIFAYQRIDLKRMQSLKSFALNKAKRLWLPCILFGIIYYAIFYSTNIFTIEALVRVVSGIGHLWYLPMLLWCFVIVWILDYLKLNKWLIFIGLSFFSLLPSLSIPLGLSRVPHFIFYFYLGYLMWIYKDKILHVCDKWKFIALFTLCYLILVIVNVHVKELIMHSHRYLIWSIMGIVRYFMTGCGIFALYLFTCHFVYKENFKCPNWVIKLSSICYGLYVFHQFILKFLYYKTDMACMLGQYLPWVGFAVALFLSYILTSLFLKTNWGRFLIG